MEPLVQHEWKESLIRVFVRIVPGSNGKSRPDWFSKAACVSSVIDAAAFARERNIEITLTAVIDVARGGQLDSALASLIAKFDFVLPIWGGSSARSWRALLEALDHSLTADAEDVLYFVEDDHLHSVDSIVRLDQGSADYRLCYVLESEHGKMADIEGGWATIAGGTSSFAVTARVFTKDRSRHRMMSRGGGAWDELSWRSIGGTSSPSGLAYVVWPFSKASPWRRKISHRTVRHAIFRAIALALSAQRHRTIKAMVPAGAAHVEPDMLPPGADWREISAAFGLDRDSAPAVVSLILPVLNGAEFIQEAIEGVRSQTFSDWNLIVLDDGSTDETVRLVREAGARDSRISLLRMFANTGKKGALAAGLALNQSELVMEINADDVLDSTALIKLIPPMVTDDCLDCSFGGHSIVDSTGAEDELHGEQIANLTGRSGLSIGYLDDALRRQLRSGLIPAGTCAMIRSSAIGPWPKFSNTHTDYWLAWRAARRGRVFYVGDKIAKYRVHSSNLTKSYYKRSKAADRIRMDISISRDVPKVLRVLLLKRVAVNIMYLVLGPTGVRWARALLWRHRAK